MSANASATANGSGNIHSVTTAQKLTKLFVFSAGCIFLVTGLAKIISTFGKAGILEIPDPVLGITVRHLMLLAGLVELGISFTTIVPTLQRLTLYLTAWMATLFLFYRIGLRLVHWHGGCPCLGHVTDALHISPATAGLLAKGLFAYLFVGSYTTIGLLFMQTRKRDRNN